MRRAFVALALLAIGCRRESFKGPLTLLELSDLSGRKPKTGVLLCGGEKRAALLESARYHVGLPRRALLTFGAGTSFAGAGEAPGWFHLAVRAGSRVVSEQKLNPRALHGFHDVSVPLEGLGRETTLEFDVSLTDRDGHPIETPRELLVGVADPVLHDLDSYGRAKGILLVSIDTLRRDHVGAYGYKKPTTPRLDALAREGLFVSDAVSTSSWTLPAHLSMFTSADPAVHGAVDINHGFNHRLPTLASLLARSGFATQAVTSHLYVSAVYGADDGFDHLDFRQDRKATDVAEHGIDLLDRFGDRPFFVFLHFYDPHWHYEPPADRLALFESSYSGTVTGIWQDFSRRDLKKLTPADVDHLRALYDGEIRYVDDELGRVLDHMRGRGLERSTLVFVTADHGEEFLEHGSWEHQKTLYEEVIRIPMLLTGPGVPARRETTQTSLLDLAPTILAWAGVVAPPTFAGRNLLAAASSGQREAFGETRHTLDHSRKLFLRGGFDKWKAIFTLAPTTDEVRSEEWYDLAADPAERKSAPPRDEVASAVRRRALERWRSGGGEAPRVELTPEQRERLHALGYVEP
jgi:arylsulfatase A-like enzyme